jgi:Flp pilus assembly protein CpaB
MKHARVVLSVWLLLGSAVLSGRAAEPEKKKSPGEPMKAMALRLPIGTRVPDGVVPGSFIDVECRFAAPGNGAVVFQGLRLLAIDETLVANQPNTQSITVQITSTLGKALALILADGAARTSASRSRKKTDSGIAPPVIPAEGRQRRVE